MDYILVFLAGMLIGAMLAACVAIFLIVRI